MFDDVSSIILYKEIISLSTQTIAKSSYQLDLAHFQPVNSTLDFSLLQAPQNEKIREPEKNSQLSETPCFQAFFGIYFCTFDSNTTHSTWHDSIRLMSGAFYTDFQCKGTGRA